MTTFSTGTQNPSRAGAATEAANQNTGLPVGLTAEDIAHLTNYPSLGRLFEEKDAAALIAMKNSLNQTFQELERVIRRGTVEDARRAQTAVEAVKLTLTFLQMLEDKQSGKA